MKMVHLKRNLVLFYIFLILILFEQVWCQNCGESMVEPNHKLTNVEETVAGEWPWMVAISLPTRYGYTTMICGGALLDKSTVLTAAHCCKRITTNLTLHFGKLYRRDVREVGMENRTSVKVIVHPNFNDVTFENDIALIKLESNLSYTEKIQPICLPTPTTTKANLIPGNKGYVTGYGVTNLSLRSDQLMMAQFPVQSSRSCVEHYANNNISLDIEPGRFCAGYPQGDLRPCSFDSGSPFVFYNRTSHRYVLEGLVSFRMPRPCGMAGVFTVFTKISNYLDWINNEMSLN